VGVSRRFGVLVGFVALAVMAVSGRSFVSLREAQTVVRGPGVSRVVPLSTWSEGLRGTAGDTNVYVLDSGKPGGTMLVMGGVHANEPAGMMAAVLLVENARLAAGRLIVIPQASASAATHVESSEGFPTRFTVKTAGGRMRWFRYGGRL